MGFLPIEYCRALSLRPFSRTLDWRQDEVERRAPAGLASSTFPKDATSVFYLPAKHVLVAFRLGGQPSVLIDTKRALDNIKPYLTSLIVCRKHPPLRTGRIDWQSDSIACGIEDEMTAASKEDLQLGLEAIIRWVDKERSKDNDRPASQQSAKKAAPSPA